MKKKIEKFYINGKIIPKHAFQFRKNSITNLGDKPIIPLYFSVRNKYNKSNLKNVEVVKK